MEKIRKNALRELVYDKIKLMILDGALVPGQKISKKELAVRLAVSQTPVSEAINRLTGEGLIEQRPREGFCIKTFTYIDLKELFAARAGLEGIAIRLCVEELTDKELEKILHIFDGFELPMNDREHARYLHADQRFHETLIALSKNSVIINFDRNFDFIMKSYQKGLIRPPEETLDEHRAILAAVVERDAPLAQELLMRHLLRSREVIKEQHLKFGGQEE
jgi:DNA-binding GntR family transcriptional regulator